MNTKCTSVHAPKRARCEEMAADIVVLREQVATLTVERDSALRRIDEALTTLGYCHERVDEFTYSELIVSLGDHAGDASGNEIRSRLRDENVALRAEVEGLTKECEGLRAAPSARRITLMKEHRKLLIEDVTRLRAVLAEAELVVERHVPEPGDEIEDESGICEASTLEHIRDVLAATSASTTPPRWDV